MSCSSSQRRPFIDFYRENGIIPVAQDIHDLGRHFHRREALYRHLGIPPGFLRGRSVIEFGPGTGHNAIYTASLTPRRYVLVDGNPASIESVQNLLESHNPKVDCAVVRSLFEEFDTEERFDVVFCEGVLSTQRNPTALARRIARFAAPEGIVVVSCADAVSVLSEILRRIAALLILDKNRSLGQQVDQLMPIFSPQLSTLKGIVMINLTQGLNSSILVL